MNDAIHFVRPEEAAYQLRFGNTNYVEWVKCGGKADDRAKFRVEIWGKWAPQEWPGYVSEPMLGFIRELLEDPNGRCSFAFRWVNSDWKTRFRMFLTTHRGTIEECEQVLLWMAWTSSQNDLEVEKWKIAIRQSDDDPLDSTLWSNTGRDCHFEAKGYNQELSGNQHKLLRDILCYFMPHYRENSRRYDAVVYELWKTGIVWMLDIPIPTQHERLEARLRLREWLNDKVAPEEIPALLGEA